MSEQSRRILAEDMFVTEALRANAKSAQISDLEKSLFYKDLEISTEQEKRREAEKKQKEAEAEAEKFRNLLAKPMAEIASKHMQFAETYRLQQEMLANWMVSQKAFKELAIQYGIQLGKAPEKVIQEGFDKAIDVLDDKHNPAHNTNVGDSVIIRPHVENLKNKINKKTA